MTEPLKVKDLVSVSHGHLKGQVCRIYDIKRDLAHIRPEKPNSKPVWIGTEKLRRATIDDVIAYLHPPENAVR